MTLFTDRFVDSAPGPERQAPAGSHRLAGIDPGVTAGAIVVLEAGQPPVKFPLPTVEVKQSDGKKKTFYDLPAIRRFLVEQDVAFVYLEIQQPQSKPELHRCKRCDTPVVAAPSQGITSTFMTGRGYGALEGMLAGIPIPYKLVHPRSWQPKLLPAGSGDTKGRARLAAKAMFPTMDLRGSDRCRTDHTGVVDALLIAVFGAREMMWTEAIDPELGF